VISADAAWRRMGWMRQVVRHQPAVAHAVSCLSLYDQLELTLDVLTSDWPETPPDPRHTNPHRDGRRSDWAEAPEVRGDGLRGEWGGACGADGLPGNVVRFRPRQARRPAPGW
jgi:hypothetical protein